MALQDALDTPIFPAVAGNWANERAMRVDTPAMDTDYYMMRMLSIPSGVYILKMLMPLGGTIRFGAEPPIIIGQTLFESLVNVPQGGEEVLVTIQMYQPAFDPDYFFTSFMLYQIGKVVYTANALDGWQTDIIPRFASDIYPMTPRDMTLPVFSLLPNWSNGITERLSYLTDILVSETNFEQRRAIREFPRRTLEANFLRAGLQRAYLDNFLAGVGHDEFMMPLWQNQYRIHYPPDAGDTSIEFRMPLGDSPEGFEFFSSSGLPLALITAGDPNVYEVVALDWAEWAGDDETTSYYDVYVWPKPLALSWSVNPRIIPLRRAHIVDKPSLSNVTDSVGTSTIRFELTEPHTDDMPSYETVWMPKLDWTAAVVNEYDRMSYSVDNESGPVVVTDPRKFAAITTRINVTSQHIGQLLDLRRFIAGVRGKAVHFFAPTFTNDIVPAFDIDGFFIDAEYTGFDKFMKTWQGARRYVCVIFNNGADPVYSEITFLSTYMSGDKKIQRFELSDSLTATIGTIRAISFLVPSRFDQDTFEFTHYVDARRVVRSALVLRSVDAVDLLPPLGMGG